ncbi:SusC/RagA family TonB-linked outer membrane protein [uncultured Polaribacter sp.]|uniref:SusC/RagA family TonB-linked outer membrane protein n=1 Tax=uncultured Polaribacter sp. TaxID=174711 RepID=UPI0026301278|nr:SusC/RagA family TonB-linked outer membrane protein [uncultured Polaribacter sp.]
MKKTFKKQNTVHSFMLLLLLLCSGFTTFNLEAQQKITGVVSDVDGNPIPGVSVLQKGTSNGVVTDFDGIYSLSLNSAEKTLVFSYLGYKNKEVKVSGKVKIDVTLEEEAEALEEIVIIGYAAVSREKVLGAVSSVKAESIEKATAVDALQGVQGKLSGVQILSNNGPGAGFDVRVRGITSFAQGGPLYVVDGQQTFDIDNIDPNDIESLEVLKDGATTAIYGAQGANGVVLVTTKSGKAGKTRLSITHTTGVNSLVGQIPVANARQRIIQETVANPNPVGNRSIRDSLSLLFRNSEDIQKLVTRPATRQQVSLSLNGGSESARFNWNSGFVEEQGIIVNSGYKRFNTRVKLDLEPSDKIKAGTVVNMSFEETKGAPSFQILNQLTRRIPYLPIFEPDGTFTPSTPGLASLNPLQQAELREVVTRNYRANSFTYLQYNFTPKFSIKSTLGFNFRYLKNETFTPSALDNRNFRLAIPVATERHDLSYNVQQENFFNYNNSWGDHTISGFAGMQIQRNNRENLRLRAELNNELITTLNNNDPENFTTTNGTLNDANSLFSLFAGFSYDYQNKYLIGATVRRDGSSRFGENNKFGYFPAANVGWRLSKESFLEDSDVINNLLLRASFGVVGNDRIGNFTFDTPFNPDFTYSLDGSIQSIGVGPGTLLGNADIRWEETESINLGVDLGLFKNRVKIAAEIWRKTTSDLLVRTELPEESGFQSIQENRGVVRNQGIDFNINGTIIKKKGFKWDAGFNISFLENEVTELAVPIQQGRFLIEEGQPIGNMIGYKNFGVFSRDESNAYAPSGERLIPNFDSNGFFLGSYSFANGQAYPTDGVVRQLTFGGDALLGGDYIWDDVNGDFVIDSEDIQTLGNGLPTVFGGLTQDFSYKGFTLGLLFDFSFGNDIYRRYDHERNSLRASVLTPSPERIENAWTNQGDITPYPTLTARNREVNRFDFLGGVANSSFVSDGSFIIWRYARVGYSFPKKTLEKMDIGLKSLRLNLAINNVLTWTNYEGYSPEFGSRGNPLAPSEDNLRYPNDRELLLSLRVQF